MKLDIGCGPNKKLGFTGLDAIAFPGVDIVADLKTKWPVEDGSVEELHCSHCIEHFTSPERCYVYNEMFRVMKVGAKATIITPSFSSGRAYGDPTHQWPPVCGFSFFYLLKAWRMANAPHADKSNWPQGYDCDFDATWGFSLHPQVAVRNQEFQQFALQFYMEAAQDIIATLTKR
jgi:ubiquinone/menaquinone biosynthesis C-methylase UbiE